MVRLTALSMISITSAYLSESHPALPLWVNRAMRCHLCTCGIHLVLKEMATFGQISSTKLQRITTSSPSAVVKIWRSSLDVINDAVTHS